MKVALKIINRRLLLPILVFYVFPSVVIAQSKNSFVVSSPDATVQIILDENEEQLVQKATELFANDIYNISNRRPEIKTASNANYQLMIGTLGVNKKNDELYKRAGIDTDKLKSQWENYVIKSSADPKGKKNLLFVVGSNSRGTAYGLMELSRKIGVSPWEWWADVKPDKKESITLPYPLSISDGPKVKYRGIFLNDEDWGLQPWAAKTFEPETGDIGPKTYEQIFQLLLRLKANTIWPAMHPSTKAFYAIPGNKEMAAKYQIFIGTSHAEPMLRNNVGEWDHNKYGEFNYATNSDVVKQYWRSRIEELSQEDNYIATLGMRGVHDSGMEGNFTKEEKVEMLERIISEQRQMLTEILKKDIKSIPQAFVPYKEVLEIYNDGAHIPEDVTLVWPDDNHGYIRRLSNDEERKRPGGGGVYYHISYWGRPHDFLWLESIPVPLIWEEMNKAFHTNAKDIWIVNVGDIKPMEIGMNFFLEMAWNIDQFSPENLTSYYNRFATEQFGETYGEEIGEILKKYFQLGFSRKPEHMGWSTIYPDTPIQDPKLSLFSNGDEVQQRLDAYSMLEEQVISLQSKLPEHLQDAFYQLVTYKVLGASNMNKKLLYAFKSRVYAGQGRVIANAYAEKSRQAYEKIKEITHEYNQRNSGRWMHMMTYNPRELPVYGMPEVGNVEPTLKVAGGIVPEGISQPVEPGKEASLPTFLSATGRRYFIDVFNSGQEPITWTAKATDPWIQLSSTGGEISTEERIWVSIDWPGVMGETNQATIQFNVGNSTYKVLVNAEKFKPQGGQLFIEDNGVVAIEAENFNSSQNNGNHEWKMIQGLGRQNDAVGTFPITAQPLDITNEKAPTLTYEFYSRSVGEANLRFYCLPSQPINNDYRLRFAVSIDNGKPVIVDATSTEIVNEYNRSWQINVLRSANIVDAQINLPYAGRHQLKIAMIDPGVVLDKIEIVTDEKTTTYFGAMETQVINTNEQILTND